MNKETEIHNLFSKQGHILPNYVIFDGFYYSSANEEFRWGVFLYLTLRLMLNFYL